MQLREQRQKEFADVWLRYKWGILLLAPRFGKCRTAIYALKMLDNPSVLIAYPDSSIKKSWDNEFIIMNYDPSNVTYTTHLSLRKYKEKKFDVVILDEIHLLSENQLFAAYELLKINKRVMGLTGTLGKETKRIIYNTLHLPVIAEYSIEKAIEEKVITDYEITVITVPLDNKVMRNFGKKLCTEKQRCKNLSYVIDAMEEKGKPTMFLRLTRMRLFQNSISKIRLTKNLIKTYKDERVLVFCGLQKVADSLDIPSYHTNTTDKKLFEEFVNGTGNHLAVVKLGNSGVTYKPLNRVIINYTDSNPENLTQKINRATSLEYDNPEKKALITIVSSDEEVELNWIKKGLAMFDKSKIRYV